MGKPNRGDIISELEPYNIDPSEYINALKFFKAFGINPFQPAVEDQELDLPVRPHTYRNLFTTTGSPGQIAEDWVNYNRQKEYNQVKSLQDVVFGSIKPWIKGYVDAQAKVMNSLFDPVDNAIRNFNQVKKEIGPPSPQDVENAYPIKIFDYTPYNPYWILNMANAASSWLGKEPVHPVWNEGYADRFDKVWGDQANEALAMKQIAKEPEKTDEGALILSKYLKENFDQNKIDRINYVLRDLPENWSSLPLGKKIERFNEVYEGRIKAAKEKQTSFENAGIMGLLEQAKDYFNEPVVKGIIGAVENTLEPFYSGADKILHGINLGSQGNLGGALVNTLGGFAEGMIGMIPEMAGFNAITGIAKEAPNSFPRELVRGAEDVVNTTFSLPGIPIVAIAKELGVKDEKTLASLSTLGTLGLLAGLHKAFKAKVENGVKGGKTEGQILLETENKINDIIKKPVMETVKDIASVKQENIIRQVNEIGNRVREIDSDLRRGELTTRERIRLGDEKIKLQEKVQKYFDELTLKEEVSSLESTVQSPQSKVQSPKLEESKAENMISPEVEKEPFISESPTREDMLRQPEVAREIGIGRIRENVPTSELYLDPQRFQFRKLANTEGNTGRLSHVTAESWNENAKGIVNVWKDPADGKTYVVNGHHRYLKAAELGKNLDIRYIDADTWQEARMRGAEINLLEGNATPKEAAWYFKEVNIQTPEDAKARGLSVSRELIRQAIDLAKLDDVVLSQVDTGAGGITVNQGALIGRYLRNSVEQKAAYDYIVRQKDPRTISLDKFKEEIDDIRNAGVQGRPVQDALFEMTEADTRLKDNLQGLRADIAGYFRKQIIDANRVATEKKADKVGKYVKEGKVDWQEASRDANKFSKYLEIFDKRKLSDDASYLRQQAQKIGGKNGREEILRETIGEIERRIEGDEFFKQSGKGQDRSGIELFEQEQTPENKGGEGNTVPDGLKESFKSQVSSPESKVQSSNVIDDLLGVERDINVKSDIGLQASIIPGVRIKEDPAAAEIRNFYREEIKNHLPSKEIENSKIDRPNILKRMGENIKKFYYQSTRSFEYLNIKDPRDANADYYLKQVKYLNDFASAESIQLLKNITKDLNKERLQLMDDILIGRDLLRNVDEGLYVDKDGNPKTLPFEFKDRADVENFLKRREEITRKVAPEVLKAIDTRNQVLSELVKRQVQRGWLKPEALENVPNYFRHQVLDYYNAKMIGRGKTVLKVPEMGYQKARKGASMRYNRDYIESEFEVFRDMIYKDRLYDYLEKMKSEIDIREQVNRLAEEQGKKWIEVIPEGYVKWRPDNTHAFNKVRNISERLIDKQIELELEREKTSGKINDDGFVESNIPDDVKTTWVIPENIARQFNDFKDVSISEGKLMDADRYINNGWKVWAILRPMKYLRYRLRNSTSDLSMAMVYPGMMKYFPNAIKECWDVYKKKGWTADVKEATARGVLQAGEFANEIPDFSKKFVFDYLRGNKISEIPARMWSRYSEFNNFIENTLRLASYKYFRKELAKGKKYYGAADRAQVDAIKDINDKAALITNETFINYKDLSKTNLIIKNHLILFWTWQIKNAPRFVKMLQNAPHEEGRTGKVAGMIGGGVLRTGTGIASMGVKLAGMYAASQAWNYLAHPEEQKELSAEGKRKGHIILGRRDDGSIKTIDLETALGDALDIVGLSDVWGTFEKIQTGEKKIYDMPEEMGKAFVNRYVNQMRPIEKTIGEAALGKSLNPDVFNGRILYDSYEHIARTWGLGNEYNLVMGKPQKSGKDIFKSAFINESDPKETAYFDIRKSVNDFLKEKGKDYESGPPSDRQVALYYFKKAKQYNDKDAMKKYLKIYLEKGGKGEGIQKSIQKAAPLAGLPNNLRGEFVMRLKSRGQTDVLKKAVEYYQRVFLR